MKKRRITHITCEAYNNFNIVQKEKFVQRKKICIIE